MKTSLQKPKALGCWRATFFRGLSVAALIAIRSNKKDKNTTPTNNGEGGGILQDTTIASLSAKPVCAVAAKRRKNYLA